MPRNPCGSRLAHLFGPGCIIVAKLHSFLKIPLALSSVAMIAILIYSFIETASEPIEKSGFFESFAHPGVSRMPFEMVFFLGIFSFQGAHSSGCWRGRATLPDTAYLTTASVFLYHKIIGIVSVRHQPPAWYGITVIFNCPSAGHLLYRYAGRCVQSF